VLSGVNHMDWCAGYSLEFICYGGKYVDPKALGSGAGSDEGKIWSASFAQKYSCETISRYFGVVKGMLFDN
jgi:hypothetical protein